MKTYITRTEALNRYPITEAELDRLVEQGIDAVELTDGNVTQPVFYDDALAAFVAERDITPEKFAHLRGHLMGMNEAAESQVLIYVYSKATDH